MIAEAEFGALIHVTLELPTENCRRNINIAI
jgi:hypothetical protein